MSDSSITYRVNFYFTNGKSVGFINISMDTKYEEADSLSQKVRDAINAFNERNKDTVCIQDKNATYYLNTYEIAYIEILRREMKNQIIR